MFAKVFASLWDGTMVGRADAQLVFIYLLANCDRKGFIFHGREKIAALTGIPIERVHDAIGFLESPDEHSKSEASEGRRIIRTAAERNWGWCIVNYEHYRSIRDEDERREAAKDRMRKLRDERRAESTHFDGGEQFAGVRHGSPPLAHADVEVEVDAESKDLPGPSAPRATDPAGFSDFWKAYPTKVGKKAAASAFKKALRVTTVETMLGAIESQKRSKRWTEGYIPNPATWLNQGRWDDEVQSTGVTGSAAVDEFMKGGVH